MAVRNVRNLASTRENAVIQTSPLFLSSLKNDLYCVEWDVKLYYTILYYTLFLSVLTAIFPGEPGLAGFIEAKDDGSGGDS